MAKKINVANEDQIKKIAEEILRLAEEVDRATKQRMKSFENEARNYAKNRTLQENPGLEKLVK